jgi:hypothetical protein
MFHIYSYTHLDMFLDMYVYICMDSYVCTYITIYVYEIDGLLFMSP